MAYLNKPKRRVNPNSNYNKDIAQKLVYNTSKWIKLRNYKMQVNPLCEKCLEEDRITPAIHIHHITPFMNGRTNEQIKWLGFDFNNLKSLCLICHQEQHNDT